ncbi:MAG TPA: Asp-tRNA(Asn)/Glu-tRNA(Gln) amidotransferase GatCAB subunit A, partial [Neisseria sp.]|nr:Asp-tRNA(Asn)/Glu-tRNA(Gln) amidotransferase GatCAB subunit A [Neisseria sp.]
MTAYTLKQAGDMLQSKQISATELAQEYLAAIEAGNAAINAYVHLDSDKTLHE